MKGYQRNLACIILLSLFVVPSVLQAQLPYDEKYFLSQLKSGGVIPTDLLNGKTIVLHSYTFTEEELGLVQEYFQRAGIDAVSYYPTDVVMAGRDICNAFADQFVRREIRNIAVLEKLDTEYRLTLANFNGKPTLIEPGQPGWTISNKILLEALKNLVRSTMTGLKKTNLLINTQPEDGTVENPIRGKRNEFYAVDMKVDLVAIPKFGDEALDRELESLVTANFPFKFKMVEPDIPEKELRKQGLLYIMCMVHTRAKVAQKLLGYNTSKSETAVVSVTYPDGPQQLKNIPANAPVFKIYFKHIDSGNIFLGNRWDADLTWQSALLNQIRGMKSELRLN
jgi:hypothetical protein